MRRLSQIFSSSNSVIYFKCNFPYLGITIRSLINENYKDFFLELIPLTSETSTAVEIAFKINNTFNKYNIDINSIVSYSTDNCPTMVAVAKELNLWRSPCVCHVLNLIFKAFVEGSKDLFQPFLSLVSYLDRSTKHTIYTKKEGIKKGQFILKRGGHLY